jgi:competence protein ComEA
MGDWFERNRGLLVVMLMNLALMGGLLIWLERPAPSPIEIAPPEPTPSPVPTATSTPSPLRVYVSGAVVRPDVYQLKTGSIVKDAIDVAGGVTEDADLIHINLAQELQDQQQIYVPRIGEEEAPPPVTGGESAPPSRFAEPAGRININTATTEELDTLPGIGPALAQRIIEYRENNGSFNSIEEIVGVSGIGEATLEKIRDLITVDN